MSELKARFIDDTYVEYYKTGKHELAQVYLKAEADKVIAELKSENRFVKERLEQQEKAFKWHKVVIQTTCKACGVKIGIFEKEKPFCFDCLCEFIYKVGKRNKEQMNIFEVTNG